MSDRSRAAARQTRRRQKLGEDAHCIRCGYEIVGPLELQPEGILCYECARELEHRPTSEYHHLIGRKLDPSLAIYVPGNVHRLLDDAKRDWEMTMRRLKIHQPLLRRRAILYAIRDFCAVIVPEIEDPIEYDEALHTKLVDRFGPDYAKLLGLPSRKKKTGL